MSGIKLTTGETLGAWSLNVMDGIEDTSFEELAAGQRSTEAGKSGDCAPASNDAASFSQRMMENLYYKKLKAESKHQSSADGQDTGKKKSKRHASEAHGEGILPSSFGESKRVSGNNQEGRGAGRDSATLASGAADAEGRTSRGLANPDHSRCGLSGEVSDARRAERRDRDRHGERERQHERDRQRDRDRQRERHGDERKRRRGGSSSSDESRSRRREDRRAEQSHERRRDGDEPQRKRSPVRSERREQRSERREQRSERRGEGRDERRDEGRDERRDEGRSGPNDEGRGVRGEGSRSDRDVSRSRLEREGQVARAARGGASTERRAQAVQRGADGRSGDGGVGELKMIVKESGGEVSATVAETNRVRAALGLAPLKGTTAPADDGADVCDLPPIQARVYRHSARALLAPFAPLAQLFWRLVSICMPERIKIDHCRLAGVAGVQDWPQQCIGYWLLTMVVASLRAPQAVQVGPVVGPQLAFGVVRGGQDDRHGFEPCAEYAGQKEGKLFKAGPLGSGYYSDLPQAAAGAKVTPSKKKVLDEAEGAAVVLAIGLERYTPHRPKWKY